MGTPHDPNPSNRSPMSAPVVALNPLGESTLGLISSPVKAPQHELGHVYSAPPVDPVTMKRRGSEMVKRNKGLLSPPQRPRSESIGKMNPLPKKHVPAVGTIQTTQKFLKTVNVPTKGTLPDFNHFGITSGQHAGTMHSVEPLKRERPWTAGGLWDPSLSQSFPGRSNNVEDQNAQQEQTENNDPLDNVDRALKEGDELISGLKKDITQKTREVRQSRSYSQGSSKGAIAIGDTGLFSKKKQEDPKPILPPSSQDSSKETVLNFTKTEQSNKGTYAVQLLNGKYQSTQPAPDIPRYREDVRELEARLDMCQTRVEDYPGTMAFMLWSETEQSALDLVLGEIVDQFYLICHEQGDILMKIRDRYAGVFHFLRDRYLDLSRQTTYLKKTIERKQYQLTSFVKKMQLERDEMVKAHQRLTIEEEDLFRDVVSTAQSKILEMEETNRRLLETTRVLNGLYRTLRQDNDVKEMLKMKERFKTMEESLFQKNTEIKQLKRQNAEQNEILMKMETLKNSLNAELDKNAELEDQLADKKEEIEQLKTALLDADDYVCKRCKRREKEAAKAEEEELKGSSSLVDEYGSGIKKYLTPGREGTFESMSVIGTLTEIRSIYHAKFEQDNADVAVGRSCENLGDFTYGYYCDTQGSDMAEDSCIRLLVSTIRFRTEYPEIDAFKRFMDEDFSLDELLLYLSMFTQVTKEASGGEVSITMKDIRRLINSVRLANFISDDDLTSLVSRYDERAKESTNMIAVNFFLEVLDLYRQEKERSLLAVKATLIAKTPNFKYGNEWKKVHSVAKSYLGYLVSDRDIRRLYRTSVSNGRGKVNHINFGRAANSTDLLRGWLEHPVSLPWLTADDTMAQNQLALMAAFIKDFASRMIETLETELDLEINMPDEVKQIVDELDEVTSGKLYRQTRDLKIMSMNIVSAAPAALLKGFSPLVMHMTNEKFSVFIKSFINLEHDKLAKQMADLTARLEAKITKKLKKDMKNKEKEGENEKKKDFYTVFSNVLNSDYRQSRPKPISWVLKLIGQIYGEKIKADAADDKENNHRRPMPEFLFEHFLTKFGVRNIAETHLMTLLSSVEKHVEEHSRVILFARFLGMFDPMPLEALNFYLLALENLFPKPQTPFGSEFVKMDMILDAAANLFPHWKAGGIRFMELQGTLAMKPMEFIYDKTTGESVMSIESDMVMEVLLQVWQAEMERMELKMIHLFKAGDINGDGTLDLEEFKVIVKHADPSKTDRDILKIYRKAHEASSGPGMPPDAFIAACKESNLLSWRMNSGPETGFDDDETAEAEFYSKLEKTWALEEEVVKAKIKDLNDTGLPNLKKRADTIQHRLDNFLRHFEERKNSEEVSFSYRLLKSEYARPSELDVMKKMQKESAE